MNKSKKVFSILLSITCILFCFFTYPVFSQTNTDSLFLPENTEMAIQGFDPVSYFETGIPQKGVRDFQSEYSNVSWFFSSAEHLRLFKLDPEKYIPQFGGRCSWAIAHNFLAKGNPTVWIIRNDRLYLFFSKGVKRQFIKNIEDNIEQAYQNWQSLSAEL